MKILDLQGALMPALGFGTWQLTGQSCVDSVQRAITIGYRHIDTAQIYENEAEVGKGIQKSGITRKAFFLTTKLWTTNLTAKRVISSTEESLNKLQTEYADLLLIHWPSQDMHLAETLSAMMQLKEKGKVKAIGVSNFPVKRMQEAMNVSNGAITCNQVEYHVLLSQKPVLNFIRAHNMALTAYSPLARGRLAKHPVLTDIGKKYGKTAGQIALRWLMEQDNVAAIPKAASEENAKRNFAIFDFELTQKEKEVLTSLGGNARYVNPSFAPEWDVP